MRISTMYKKNTVPRLVGILWVSIEFPGYPQPGQHHITCSGNASPVPAHLFNESRDILAGVSTTVVVTTKLRFHILVSIR